MIISRIFKNSLSAMQAGPRLFTRVVSAFNSLNDQSDLTEEQKAIQETAYNFARNQIAPYAQEWDIKSIFPVHAMKQAAQLGFAAIYCSPDFGGSGLNRLAASLVFEALATACVPTSAYLSIHNMNCWLIDTFGNKDQKEKWLTEMTGMNMFSSYCLTEPNSGSDAGSMKTSAKKAGGDYVINGSKCFISGGGISDVYLLMCLTNDKEKSCVIVPKDAKGLSFGKQELKMGWKSSPTTVVTFDNVRVPRYNLLGKEGDGFKMAMKSLDSGRINIASTSLGGAAFALDKAKQYMGERKQFGKFLNEFQYLQFKLADMATDLVTARLLVRDAAKKLDSNHKDKAMYSAMAKRYATDKCFDIVDKALQLHGGMGYTVEGGVERYLRDLRVNRILEGTNEIMKLIISKHLIKNL